MTDPTAYFDMVSTIVGGQELGKPKGLNEDGSDATDTLAGWFEVLAIFGSYVPGETIPMTGGHDVVWIGVSPDSVSEGHKARLEELGWIVAEEHGCFQSYQNN